MKSFAPLVLPHYLKMWDPKLGVFYKKMVSVMIDSVVTPVISSKTCLKPNVGALYDNYLYKEEK